MRRRMRRHQRRRRGGTIKRVADVPVEGQGRDGGEAVREEGALEGEEGERGGEMEVIGGVEVGEGFGVASTLFFSFCPLE